MKIEFEGLNEDALLVEPRDLFDPCVVGVCAQTGRAIYDVEKMIKAFSESNGCPDEESEEYIQYNILDAYLGEGTPIYLYPISKDIP